MGGGGSRVDFEEEEGRYLESTGLHGGMLASWLASGDMLFIQTWLQKKRHIIICYCIVV